MSCENCANAYDEGYTAGHNAENARLRAQAEALADALRNQGLLQYTARECLTDDDWNTLLSLAYDGQMFRNLNEKGHVVEFTDSGYGLEHPATCRIEGRLLDCPVEVHIRSLTGNPFGDPGRYRVVIGERGVLEGWKLPEKDALDV